MTAKVCLLNQGYSIERRINEPVVIDARFILPISPNDCESIAEVLKRIELFFSHRIDLVKSDETKPRCYYCASLNEVDANQCSQCGAPL